MVFRIHFEISIADQVISECLRAEVGQVRLLSRLNLNLIMVGVYRDKCEPEFEWDLENRGILLRRDRSLQRLWMTPSVESRRWNLPARLRL